MNKKMIYHIISSLVLGIIYYLVVDGATITHVAIFVGTYALVSLVMHQLVKKRLTPVKKNEPILADAQQVTDFIQALGGVHNISSVDSESARIKVGIKDVDLINQEQLKALNFEGAFLSGAHLQVTVGPNSGDFSRQIGELIR